jgi:hypothetical protein
MGRKADRQECDDGDGAPAAPSRSGCGRGALRRAAGRMGRLRAGRSAPGSFATWEPRSWSPGEKRRAQRERELAERLRATWPTAGATFEGLPIIGGGPH